MEIVFYIQSDKPSGSQSILRRLRAVIAAKLFFKQKKEDVS
jgi:hypothetical protein